MKHISLLITVALVMMFIVPSLASKKGSKANPTLTSASSPIEKSNIKGVVLDQRTQEKLAGVSIQIGSSQEKIYSDPDGSFVISNFEPGNNTITVKCISYKDKVVSLDMKDLKKGKFNVLLEPVLP